MKVTLKPIEQQTIVITGGSSGIGRATAELAAAQGARIVVASRNETALEDTVRGIEAGGGTAMHVVTDVSKRDQIERLAERTIAEFGGYDTWVNNAGIGIYGRITDVSIEDHRQLFEATFWSQVYGSLTATRHLREKGGALINLGSIVSDRAMPLLGMYSAAKHAIKAFTDALRMELEEQGAPISVTLIKPSSINTMFSAHAKSYLSRHPQFPPPVYDPQVVAEAIVSCASHPRRDLTIGGGGRALASMGANFPRLGDRIFETTSFEQQQREQAEPGAQDKALYEPMADERVRGDYPGRVLKHSAYTAMEQHPMASAMSLLGAVAMAGLAACAVRGSRRPDDRKRREGRGQGAEGVAAGTSRISASAATSAGPAGGPPTTEPARTAP